MGLLVLFQVGGCSKAFATLTTGIWLLTCMDLLVLLQMPSADKALSALCAFVRLVFRMHLHVFSQCDGCSKALSALRASVRLIWQMNHLMGLEAVGIDDIFAHDFYPRGNIGLLFHVNFHVLLEAGLYSKTLTTVNTDVRIEVLVDLKVLMKISYAAKNLTTLVALQAMRFVYDYTVLRLNC